MTINNREKADNSAGEEIARAIHNQISQNAFLAAIRRHNYLKPVTGIP
jgi:hypothetical protein